MPVTPLHYPYAWLLSKLDRRLPLPALVVGSVIPDIEWPFLTLFFSGVLPDHYIFHSLAGSLTLGLLLAVVTTRYIYPNVMAIIFGLDKKQLEDVCRITPMMVLAVVIGILSHLIVDYPMHSYNQILWPFVDAHLLVGQLVQVFAIGENLETGHFYAGLIVSMISIILLVAIMYKVRDDLWSKMWIGESTVSAQASPIES